SAAGPAPAPPPVATAAPQTPEIAVPPAAVPAPPQTVRAGPVSIPVDLRSTPSGARVTLHGRLLGHTPLSVRLPPDRTLLLVFEAQGRVSIAERVRARDGLVVTAHLPPAAVAPGLDDLKASPY
ncbi:MAG TPA: PEGA domain-containing protein, partial [Myxococcaceae bacterium]|nr:PEGA domain-containing protein [Myxococcaceae bacterium]